MQSSLFGIQEQENTQKPILKYYFAGGILPFGILVGTIFTFVSLFSLLCFLFSIVATIYDQSFIDLFGRQFTMGAGAKNTTIAILVILFLAFALLTTYLVLLQLRYHNTYFYIYDDKISGKGYSKLQKSKIDFNIPYSELDNISLVDHKLILNYSGQIYETKITSKEFEIKLEKKLKTYLNQ